MNNYTIYSEDFNGLKDYMKNSEIGVVVQDVEQANDIFTALVGLEKKPVHPYSLEETYYYGKKCPGKGLRVDYQLGSLYVKFMQPENDDSIFTDHLKKNGSGLQHICIKVKSLDELDKHMRANGYKIIQEQSWDFGRGIFYDFTKELGVCLEFVEIDEDGLKKYSEKLNA